MLKKLSLTLVALVATYISAMAISGNQLGFPIIGGASYCASTGNGGVCNSTIAAGPTTITGNETIIANTNLASGANPQTALLQTSLLANGYGGTTLNSTTGTGQAIVVADGTSNYIYSGAGTATFATFTFPPNPAQNQKLCLTNAGTGVLTTTSIVVGTSGQLIKGTAVTSIPVATAVGTAATVTLSSNCWLYNVSDTSWYRVL